MITVLNQMGRQNSAPAASSRTRGGGDLLVSMGHQPGAVDKLTVVVLKARNIPTSSDVTNGCLLAYPITGETTSALYCFNQRPCSANDFAYYTHITHITTFSVA